ncbi:peptidoglycan-binding protein [Xanthomonas albilineans]|uniref:peptidoglycan-binding protein n=1 Tax=Xanthomonas albilineans TaxID=29447 RepID=UPI001E49962E|nr:peptidoglycan-binding protein [Xanthomonas albilineans]
MEKPHRIIIAYRGTDPGLFSGETKAEKASHALTTVQDIAVDATMVRDAVNPQKAAADAFTAHMLAKAAEQGIPKDHVTVAGHSLGGALAQIEAAKYGLSGSTYNAYGAVSLRHHVPEGGTAVTNYVLAGDPVSAASRHYGTVVTLATPENVQALKDAHYLDVSHGASSPNPLRAMRLGDHSGTHFTGPQSVLSPERLVQFQANYAHNKAAFDHFRQDVHQDRELLNMALNPVATTAMAAKAEALAVQVRAEHAYDAGRQTVERGIHAVEHTAVQAYDTLTHPGQWFQHSAPAASIHPTSTNADASSSSSSSSAAAASMPPPAMDRHTALQEDHAVQQRQEHIRQAQQQAAHLAQAHRHTQQPPAHSNPVHEKPASVDMQEQARIAQLQQQEQQAQAVREQQHQLAQQHAQLHRQAVDAQQREHEQRHNQDTRSHHEQRQAGEAMLHTPGTMKAPHLLLTTAQPLEPGDRGVAVQALQQHLQTIGVTDRDGNPIKDDKHYGPRTQQAVEDFQRLAGREPTGIADTCTLQALQTHAQFAARQKAQHLSPDRHLADHASRSTDAMIQYSAPPRPGQPPAQQQAAPKALEPYSSPTSPLHALYAQTKATIENRGVSMSEERMHQLVGKMAVQGMTTEGKNDFAVKGDTLYAREFDVPYNHFMLDLREPAPSVQSTLQQVQTQLQIQEAELTAMRQQQQQNQYEHPYSL